MLSNHAASISLNNQSNTQAEYSGTQTTYMAGLQSEVQWQSCRLLDWLGYDPRGSYLQQHLQLDPHSPNLRLTSNVSPQQPTEFKQIIVNPEQNNLDNLKDDEHRNSSRIEGSMQCPLAMRRHVENLNKLVLQ